VQVEGEIASCVDLTKLVLETLGLTEYHVRFSLRDPSGDKYVGDIKNWEMAQKNIRNVLVKTGLKFEEAPGEAAFYGPKIDFVVKDCVGRQWQLGTIQVDYNLPQRFELEYVGADNASHQPVMIHRAPFGALERFIGILIEHFAGAFPLWLVPVQVAVLPVSEKVNEYAADVAAACRQGSLRVEVDYAPDKIGAKIRRWTMQKVPYLFVVGQREAEGRSVAVRQRSSGEIGTVELAAAMAGLEREVATKGAQAAFSAATGKVEQG
jgi:threonyl-tRNA synthetase